MQGRMFLLSVVRANDPAGFTRFDEQYYTEEELPLYQFVRDHKLRFGVLPTAEVLRESGFAFRALPENQPVEYYADRLRRRFIYRAAADSMGPLAAAMQAQDTDALVELYRGTLARMGHAVSGNSVTRYEDEIGHVVTDYQEARRARGRLRGITLGWNKLDALTLGAMPGDLVVIAARMGVGKTTILSKMALSAFEAGSHVLYLSMEMSKLAVTRRMIGLQTGINPNMMRAGELSRWAEQMLQGHADTVRTHRGRLYMESAQGMRTTQEIQDAVEQFRPEAVYVDAAYLLSAVGRAKGYVSRWEQLSEVIRQLKELAMRMGIPVFITVQFNRQQNDKGTRELDLSDIAGSDTIPQDASLVIGVKRAPDPYSALRRILEVMKNREGDVCTFPINYLFEPVNLDEIVEEEQEERLTVSVTNMNWML